MSEQLVIGLAAQVVALLTALLTGYLTYRIRRLKVQVEAEAARAQLERERLAARAHQTGVKLDDMDGKLSAIHDLVNGRLAAALKLIYDMAQERADKSGLAADFDLAHKAREALWEHLRREDAEKKPEEGKGQPPSP